MKRTLALLIFTLMFVLQNAGVGAVFQSHTLFGDLKIDESKVPGLKSMSFVLTLQTMAGLVVNRTTIPANGRYRFFEVSNGEYELIVETGGSEIARISILLQEKASTDIRRDIELQWRPDFTGQPAAKPGIVPPLETYARARENAARLEQAMSAGAKKDFKGAVSTLQQIVDEDPNDFEAWEELGTMLFRQEKYSDAEKAYRQALALRPAYVLALLNLGKLQLARKNFDAAVATLEGLVQEQPLYADAQYYLGEAYLQVKKGSKAVPCLNEAIRLDPAGMADAHLRLAALYNAAGMKDRAATEYEMFLAKKPDYPDKAKLQKYIKDNKK